MVNINTNFSWSTPKCWTFTSWKFERLPLHPTCVRGMLSDEAFLCLEKKKPSVFRFHQERLEVDDGDGRVQFPAIPLGKSLWCFQLLRSRKKGDEWLRDESDVQAKKFKEKRKIQRSLGHGREPTRLFHLCDDKSALDKWLQAWFLHLKNKWTWYPLPQRSHLPCEISHWVWYSDTRWVSGN